MTLKALKEKIKGLSEEKQNELNKLEVTIDYPHLNINQTIKRFVNIYRFVQKQYNGWSKLKKGPKYLEHSQTYFSNIYEGLNGYVNSGFDQSNARDSKRYLEETIELLEKDEQSISYHDIAKVFTYDAPETIFLMDLHNAYPNSIKIAIKGFIKEDLDRIDLSFDNFIGMYQAIEFRNQDIKRIQRSESETKSIKLLKDDFSTQIDDAEEKLQGVIENYNNWLTQTKEEFTTFNQQSKQTIKDKEVLYGEKLKLEKPADYWQKRATKLETEGKKWLIWLIGSSSIAVLLLGVVLFFISDGTLKDLFKENGSAIRWSVVFITFISFLAFGVRTFTKLMFSAFHLARDAEEREQLAYVYLALVNDKNIEEKERHLVLQSLFSRADSGLLKSDTSPTMPGGILEKLTK